MMGLAEQVEKEEQESEEEEQGMREVVTEVEVAMVVVVVEVEVAMVEAEVAVEVAMVVVEVAAEEMMFLSITINPTARLWSGIEELKTPLNAGNSLLLRYFFLMEGTKWTTSLKAWSPPRRSRATTWLLRTMMRTSQWR
jgi:hypothetical protein